MVDELVESRPELSEDEEFERLSEIMSEGIIQGEAAVRIVERNVLRFKANIGFVGVRVARQSLITEFLDD